jgi:putative SOS response-associated peptidase YedK
MCSRYKYNPKEFANLKIRFIVDRDLQLKPEYDLYPKQYAPVLISTGDEFALKLFRWWLTPFFFETEFTGYSMYNAKAETLTQKGSYKHLLGKRHCLVPASSPWQKSSRERFLIRRTLGQPYKSTADTPLYTRKPRPERF